MDKDLLHRRAMNFALEFAGGLARAATSLYYS
jgi:hypothetical protein